MRDNMFLETADRIGRRLCRDAVWSGNACNWLGWALEVVGPTWTPVYKAQNSTIYDGPARITHCIPRLYRIPRVALQLTPPHRASYRAIAALTDLGAQYRHRVYNASAVDA